MTKPQIQHLKLKNTELDPYQLFKNKSNRMSWNRLLETESFIDKEAMIDWFSQL